MVFWQRLILERKIGPSIPKDSPANGITTDAKKRAILLSCCQTFTKLSPQRIQFHRTCGESEKAQRATTFRDCSPISVQYPKTTCRGEYVAVLRKACNFGDSLNKMLRDRLVYGITDTTVQKHLLAEKDLTLDKAVRRGPNLHRDHYRTSRS